MQQVHTHTTPAFVAGARDKGQEWGRFGAAAGATYVVLALVGNSINSGASFDADPWSFRLGAGLEWAGFVFLTVFIAYLYTTLSRADSSWLPAVALTGGIATLAVKLSTSAPWLVTATLRSGELGSQLDQTLDDIGAVGFRITFFTFGLFVVAAAASLRRAGLVARWTSWPGIALGSAAMATVNLDFDWEIAVLPFLLMLLWVIVLSATLVIVEHRRLKAS